jgi:hypothetical protein
MEYKLVPKRKSDVEFNGKLKSNDSWPVPCVEKVSKEFDARFENIKKLYEDLLDEVYWNNLIYGIKFRFEPVIGHTYYLYKNENEYFISLISPEEWFNRDCVGKFKFEHTGKWIKID